MVATYRKLIGAVFRNCLYAHITTPQSHQIQIYSKSHEARSCADTKFYKSTLFASFTPNHTWPSQRKIDIIILHKFNAHITHFSWLALDSANTRKSRCVTRALYISGHTTRSAYIRTHPVDARIHIVAAQQSSGSSITIHHHSTRELQRQHIAVCSRFAAAHLDPGSSGQSAEAATAATNLILWIIFDKHWVLRPRLNRYK